MVSDDTQLVGFVLMRLKQLRQSLHPLLARYSAHGKLAALCVSVDRLELEFRQYAETLGIEYNKGKRRLQDRLAAK